MNNVLDIMHKKVLLMTLYVDEHGQGQKRTALEWVSFVKNIIHVNKIVVIELLNSKIKGEFHCFSLKGTTGLLNMPKWASRKTLNLYFRYYISKAQFINANDAKIACKAKGKHWDLAIIEDKQEHSFLNKKMGGCIPYWVGMTNPTGTELKDHQGNDVTFANWDTHLGKALEIKKILVINYDQPDK